jgi:ADP-L-glycero-D-manno-heptose 6-epimerase
VKKILLTGSKGFVGSRFLETMSDKYDIVTLDKDEVHKMESILLQQGIDCVFHIGAETDTTSVDVQEIFKYNCLFSDRLIELSLHLNIPVVFSSSASLYGNGNNIPLNPYAWSKWVTENKWGNHHLFTALRYYNVFGIGEHNKNLKMTSVLYQHLRKDKFILFGGCPIPKRDFVYVDDVVSANIHAFENKLYGVFDVGTGTARPFEDFAQIMGKQIEYIENPIKSQYQDYTCADERKFLTNWKPQYTLESAIKNITAYYNV